MEYKGYEIFIQQDAIATYALDENGFTQEETPTYSLLDNYVYVTDSNSKGLPTPEEPLDGWTDLGELKAAIDELSPTTDSIKAELEELRQALRDENISQGELARLSELADYIEFGDVELLEPAGVPEGTRN